MSGTRVVLVSVPSEALAKKMSRILVSERLAACVTRWGTATSVYRWRGRLEQAREHLLLVKTTRGRVSALTRRLRSLHPYEVPEILALTVSSGHPPYLRWVRSEVG